MGGHRHAPAALSPGKRPGTHCGWAPEPVWTGAENLGPAGIRSSDRPARSKSDLNPVTSEHAAEVVHSPISSFSDADFLQKKSTILTLHC